MLKLIEKLSNAFGVSGNESEVRDIIIKEIKSHVDDVRVDKMGNLICHHKGKKPTVVLAAHMDEIGLMVREIDHFGHIYFSLIGGISSDSLIAQKVHILARKEILHGVITHKTLQIDETSSTFPTYKEMYVDTGLSKKELEKRRVRKGTYIIPEKKFSELNKNIISGKALDDRLGCAILIELAKRMKKSKTDIYYIFTVQEEIGLYGAKTSMYQIYPAWGLAVDTTSSDDVNTTERGLNHGPVITIKDSGFIANKCLVETLVNIAEKNKIPYQIEVTDLGSTDALIMSLSKGGVPTGVVSVPIRNIHSTVSIAHIKDVENSILLLEALLKKPPMTCITLGKILCSCGSGKLKEKCCGK